jgi:hypothetical protein
LAQTNGKIIKVNEKESSHHAIGKWFLMILFSVLGAGFQARLPDFKNVQHTKLPQSIPNGLKVHQMAVKWTKYQ